MTRARGSSRTPRAVWTAGAATPEPEGSVADNHRVGWCLPPGWACRATQVGVATAGSRGACPQQTVALEPRCQARLSPD